MGPVFVSRGFQILQSLFESLFPKLLYFTRMSRNLSMTNILRLSKILNNVIDAVVVKFFHNLHISNPLLHQVEEVVHSNQFCRCLRYGIDVCYYLFV